MKKAISIILVLLLMATLAFSMISCGDDVEEPITDTNPDDNIPEWNDPSVNPEGGTQFRPVPLPPSD